MKAKHRRTLEAIFSTPSGQLTHSLAWKEVAPYSSRRHPVEA